jgi:hypothetical protein
MSGTASPTCDPCDVGKFNNKKESDTCYYCSNVVKGSTTDFTGASSESDCGCEAGFFKSTETGHCEVVEEGVSKNVTAMNVTTLDLEPNYWRNSDASLKIKPCKSDSACLGGTEPSAYCAEGHTGPFCGVCKPGFSEVGSSASGMQCVECDGDRALTIALGVTLLTLFLFLPFGYLYYKRRKNEEGNVEALESTAADVKQVLAKKALLEKNIKTAQEFRQSVQTVSKILLSYVQIVSGFSFNFGMSFPDIFTSVMSVCACARARKPKTHCVLASHSNASSLLSQSRSPTWTSSPSLRWGASSRPPTTANSCSTRSPRCLLSARSSAFTRG